MITKIATVAVVVKDTAKSAKWYSEKLGLQVAGDLKEHWVTVGPKRREHRIHLCQQKQLEPGNTGIALYCDDLDKTYQELEKKGVKFTRKPVKESWGSYAMLSDPDGNEFWLYEEE